jgi:hypothetical protein
MGQSGTPASEDCAMDKEDDKTVIASRYRLNKRMGLTPVNQRSRKGVVEKQII